MSTSQWNVVGGQNADYVSANSGTGWDRRYFYIENKYSGLVLGVATGVTSEGADVILEERNVPATPGQLWYLDSEDIIRNKMMNFTMKPKASCTKMHSYDGHNSMKWTFDKTCHRIVNVVDPSMSLGIYGEVPKKGSRVCLGRHGNDIWQQTDAFALKHRCFYIVHRSTEKVLDVYKECTTGGARVVLWPKNDKITNNQLWYCDDEGIIRSKMTDFAIEPEASRTTCHLYNGLHSRQWTYDQTLNAIVNIQKRHLCIKSSHCGFSMAQEVVISEYTGDQEQVWYIEYEPKQDKQKKETNDPLGKSTNVVLHEISTDLYQSKSVKM